MLPLVLGALVSSLRVQPEIYRRALEGQRPKGGSPVEGTQQPGVVPDEGSWWVGAIASHTRTRWNREQKQLSTRSIEHAWRRAPQAARIDTVSFFSRFVFSTWPDF
jgi:hypothetical protein